MLRSILEKSKEGTEMRGRYYQECSECWAYSSTGSGKCLLPSEVECPLGMEAPFPDQESFLEYIFAFDKARFCLETSR